MKIRIMPVMLAIGIAGMVRADGRDMRDGGWVERPVAITNAAGSVFIIRGIWQRREEAHAWADRRGRDQKHGPDEGAITELSYPPEDPNPAITLDDQRYDVLIGGMVPARIFALDLGDRSLADTTVGLPTGDSVTILRVDRSGESVGDMGPPLSYAESYPSSGAPPGELDTELATVLIGPPYAPEHGLVLIIYSENPDSGRSADWQRPVPRHGFDAYLSPYVLPGNPTGPGPGQGH